MTSLRSRSRIFFAAGAALLALTLTAGTATAQLRYVTGSFVDFWNRFDPPDGAITTTTTVTTVGGRQCNVVDPQTPSDPCQGNLYPFVSGQNVRPKRATGAVQSAGLGVGDPVNLPYANEWTQQISGMIPAGVIPGVLSIWTIFSGANDVAMPASGKGLASGAGPGNFVWQPVAAGVPGSTMFQTYAFATPNDPGQTTASAGTLVSTNFPSIPAMPVGAVYTPGPRQYGGTAAILSDTPNRLTLDFGASIYQRTNGKCPAGLPFGDCAVGYRWGEDHRQTSVRRNVNTTNPAIVLGQHGYWHGNAWTTGTVEVRDDPANPGNTDEWMALSGTDTTTSMGARHLVLVSPILNYDRSLFGAPQTSVHVGQWDMTIQTPEPGAAIGILAGAGALLGLHRRARRRA